MSKFWGCTIKIPESGEIYDKSIGGALTKLDRHLGEKYNTSINALIAENHRGSNGKRRNTRGGGSGNGFDVHNRIFRRSRK
jgi:hypothetical protein